MTETVVTVRLPADVIWWCRLLRQLRQATTQPLARSGAIEHLAAEHRATIDYTNGDPE